MKQCGKCKILKESSEFSRNKRRRDGLAYECKICASIRDKNNYRQNLEKRKEYDKQRRLNNPEKWKEISKAWRVKNPGRQKELRKRWQINHPEKIKEYNKKN